MSTQRHLPWPTFQENYLDPGVPALMSIGGTPEILVTFQPQQGILGLIARIEIDGDIPIDRRNIYCDTYQFEGSMYPRVFVRDEPLFREFYAVCTEVADRCQTAGEPFADSVVDTIAAFDLLLRSAITLPANEEIGLVGELLVLEAVLNLEGPAAVNAWRGPDRDKHDFRTSNQELEVKTTTGEKRQHWIHGLTQLDASKGCDLDLISVQLARTSGSGNINLIDTVERIRQALKPHPVEFKKFGDLLSGVVGPARLETAEGQFQFRSDVAGYAITGEFPRISKPTLDTALGDSARHIGNVNYVLDLEDLAACPKGELAKKVVENLRSDHA